MLIIVFSPSSFVFQQVVCLLEELGSNATLSIWEPGREEDDPGAAFRVAAQEIPDDIVAPDDFPVYMTVWTCRSTVERTSFRNSSTQRH